MKKLLNDPRDMPQLALIAQCTIIIIAAGILFYLGSFSWWLAVAYWALWGSMLGDRVTTMLHTFIHRPLFKRPYRFLDAYVNFVITPFFGQSPWNFYVHHIGMHHAEENLADDLSSTMGYQRDSALGFFHYYFRFAIFGTFNLTRYHLRRGHTKMALRLLLGKAYVYALFIGLGSWHLQPTLVVFVIPYVLAHFMLMAGNWGQHVFIDPEQPDNYYTSSITVITERYNKRCFNDGYHTYHHIKSGVHYSELKEEFENNREKYGREDAFVFDKLDFVAVWFMLLAGRHKALARYLVRLPGAPERTDDEVVEVFRRRLAPIRSWKPARAAQIEGGQVVRAF